MITIDNIPVEVSPEMTVLEAAKRAGHTIPTLCYFMSDPHQGNQNASFSGDPDLHNLRIVPASCQVCLVKINGRIVPSCTAKVAEGMVVECDTAELVALRRTAFELLLSDHVGDCEAPCRLACPTRLDVPRMLREIAANRLDLAIQTIWQSMPFPAILGRICSRPCERVCRRNKKDEAVSICQLKRYVADTVLGKVDVDALANVKPCSGKHVAIVGAGISGLCTAFHLAVHGCQVTLFEQKDVCGGRLNLVDPALLPPEVLELELEHLLTTGNDERIVLRRSEPVSWFDPQFPNTFLDRYDAVVLAAGMVEGETEGQKSQDSESNPANHNATVRIDQIFQIDRKTGASNVPGLFAVGTVLRGKAPYVRSVADGREVALSVLAWLETGKPLAASVPFSVHVKKPTEDELDVLGQYAGQAARIEPLDAGTDDYSLDDVQHQAARCLHCDCRGREKCRLLQEAAKLDLDVNRFAAESRRSVRIERSGDIFFEPGKCIKCGLCVRITEKFGEPYGLTFIGRGFDVQINVPFDRSLDEGLQKVGRLCAEACPTGALTLAEGV